MKHQIYESICRLGADETWSLARRLVAEHLTTNAAMEVNLSAHIRGRIELTMATAPTMIRLPTDLFEVRNMMTRNSL